MNSRNAWVIAVILLAGCGEQENAKLPSPQSKSNGAAPAAGGFNNRAASDVAADAPYTKAEIKAAIKAVGGRWGTNNSRVNFAGTQMTDAELEYVMEYVNWLPSLRRLRVANTQITNAGLAHITGLINLRELDLSNTQITDAGLEHIKAIPKLRLVRLAGTPVTDAALEILKGLPDLGALDITDTQITDAGLEHIKEIKNLKSLWVSKNQFTEAGIEELAAALPNCRIVRN